MLMKKKVRKETIILVTLLLSILLISGCITKESKVEVKFSSEPRMVILEKSDGWEINIFMSFPNPCHKVEYVGRQVRGNEYYLDFSYIPPSKDEACVQVIKNYNETIKLGKLSKGEYKVFLRINGKEIKSAVFDVK